MHGLGGQQDDEIHHKLPFGADDPQIELPAAGDHVVEHGVQRKLILARPPRHQLSYVGAMLSDERRSRSSPVMPRIGGKQPREVAVIRLGWREGVEGLLFLVVLAK